MGLGRLAADPPQIWRPSPGFPQIWRSSPGFRDPRAELRKGRERGAKLWDRTNRQEPGPTALSYVAAAVSFLSAGVEPRLLIPACPESAHS